jgi:hypothetical protein
MHLVEAAWFHIPQDSNPQNVPNCVARNSNCYSNHQKSTRIKELLILTSNSQFLAPSSYHYDNSVTWWSSCQLFGGTKLTSTITCNKQWSLVPRTTRARSHPHRATERRVKIRYTHPLKRKSHTGKFTWKVTCLCAGCANIRGTIKSKWRWLQWVCEITNASRILVGKLGPFSQ